ncbi:MAG: GNAT family N-acetyltransferase [Gemmataceae bacterium]|nr:GNAT family N-acetyltransferase [Gemmataceae bacterium]
MIEIATARPDEWFAALELALRPVPAEDRASRVLHALALLNNGEVDPGGVLAARVDGALAGVQVAIPMAGASGLLWLPQVVPAWQDSPVAERLVAAATTWLHSRGAKLAQALVSPSHLPEAGPLLRCGFRHITTLHYLRRDLHDLPQLTAPAGWQVRSYTAQAAELFHRTLEATYTATLDCPELTNVRTMTEIIEGHRAQGVWRPDRWLLACLADQAVGVAMVTELYDHAGWDLSYLGLVPQFRGRGLGSALLVAALSAARRDAADAIVVAVDARNWPARRLYERFGFVTIEQREVLLKILQQS